MALVGLHFDNHERITAGRPERITADHTARVVYPRVHKYVRCALTCQAIAFANVFVCANTVITICICG